MYRKAHGGNHKIITRRHYILYDRCQGIVRHLSGHRSELSACINFKALFCPQGFAGAGAAHSRPRTRRSNNRGWCKACHRRCMPSRTQVLCHTIGCQGDTPSERVPRSSCNSCASHPRNRTETCTCSPCAFFAVGTVAPGSRQLRATVRQRRPAGL